VYLLNLKKIIYILIAIVSISVFVGCGGDSSIESQGIIIYKVSYPKMDKHNLMFDFMPKKMVLKFKDDKYVTNMTAGMGMFKTNIIVDQEQNQFSQMVKLINKKYILTLKGANIEKSLANSPKYHVEHTEETKIILNYLCKKAIVTMDNEERDVFTVYYTDKIKIKNPNWCNQFSEIGGVMLEYQYEKYGVHMKFEAKDIKFTEVDNGDFVIDAKYEAISEAAMDKEMQEIFDSFN